VPGPARYDAVADFYEAGWPDSYTEHETAALLDLVGAIEGLRVLDVACGNGRMTRELARRGGAVVGVDISRALIERARVRETEDALGVQYIEGDVSTDNLFGDAAFDVVVCCFGLSDIDDLDGALTTVARALVPGGAFVFSLLHPCFPGAVDVAASWPPEFGYHREGRWFPRAERSTLRRQVGANHRMVSTYVNALTSHGLVLDVIREPPPPPTWSTERPDAVGLPLYLVARCRKR
jgi:2-polyprenyl-3-methyl-5-hydroxy-6-metoxy-1,4-benzoquinol methylase